MKRTLFLILCLVLAFSLFGCGSEKEEAAPALQVGFGRAEITPKYSVPLAGYPNHLNRWSTNVLDPLYATCIAFADAQDNTILLYTLDLCNLGGTAISFARKEISEVTGLPINNIMASSTHTHSAPIYNIQEPAISWKIIRIMWKSRW